MRIAAFNVENLFARARAFDDVAGGHADVLSAHAALNRLFALPVYAPQDKADMLTQMATLGVLRTDNGALARIRRIRGQLVRRPRQGAPSIVANGRADWVGWCELTTEPVDEIAMDNTARVIRDVAADVLAVVEAESRPVLMEFQEMMLARVGVAPADGYAHVMLIDGNDARGIDVGLATRAGFPIGAVRSHVDLRDGRGERVFSRDCPAYRVATPSGARLTVLPNHFKSKFGGDDAASSRRRRAQAEAVAGIVARLTDEGEENIVVLGDLNDTPDSQALAPLLQGGFLRDASEHPAFTEVEFRAGNGQRGLGTYGLGNDDAKIDYLLLSPALFARVTLGGIFRKGAWPGVSPRRWDVYPELTAEVHAASDHHAIWADIDL
jgi:endonuclease/exonuclease/phosphatase family metal-dependent hydrolase